MAPRKHAALIHAFADGAEIEFKAPSGKWEACDGPMWSDCVEYRIKPAAPAYPETTMTGFDLLREWRGGRDERASDMRLIANAALRHAIDTGLVATKEACDQVNTALAEAERRLAIQPGIEYGQRVARDLAVAEAVRSRVVELLGKVAATQNYQGATAITSAQGCIADMLDLHPIIASVP